MAQRSTKKSRIPVHGVLLLDKPAGYSSNDALVKAKRLLDAQKAGHTGTLDPFATGLLPLCFGEATKFSQDLLEADKEYEALVHLGLRTTTGDTEGEIIERCTVMVTRDQIDAALAGFRGAINQTPPMYSALKRDGKPLYEYARAGITLERAPRQVHIHELEFLDFTEPLLRIRVRCSKGTYIRVLAEDIGATLGCGAHLQALRRTGVGDLALDGAITLDALAKAPDHARAGLLAPVDALLSTFPSLTLNEELSKRFLHGQRLALANSQLIADRSPGRIRVYREVDGALLGTAQLQAFGVLAPERLVVATTES